ncbi:MAG: hypothetical protein ABJB11_19735 [Ferruginibacter sp.]
MFIIIILLLLFGLLTGAIYLTLFTLTFAFTKLTNKPTLSIENKKNLKKIFLIGSLMLAGITTYVFLFTSPSTNYKTAFIATEKDHFVLTVKGRRLLMVHDPVSLFFRKTYKDSANYIIPRKVGIIKGEELPTEPGYYKSVGTITIQNHQVEINLSADNYDDNKLDPDSWNGKYKLVYRDR